MDINQTFYNNMASQYDKLFLDWNSSTREQAEMLGMLFAEAGFDRSAQILDCACGIGTQAIGLAAAGYSVTASDISTGELAEAKNVRKMPVSAFALNGRISAHWLGPSRNRLIL